MWGRVASAKVRAMSAMPKSALPTFLSGVSSQFELKGATKEDSFVEKLEDGLGLERGIAG